MSIEWQERVRKLEDRVNLLERQLHEYQRLTEVQHEQEQRRKTLNLPRKHKADA